MNRQLISVAIGNIRDDHITAALLYTPKARANHYSRETNRPRPTKRMIAIVLAAALLLAFAITAYATGWFESFFAKVSEQYNVPDPERYEHAGDLSSKEPETINLKDLPGNTFTLSESFYDGEDLLLAYSLDSMKYPAQFGFGPGDENFDQLTSTGPWYIDGQWENQVPAEDYERICEALRSEENTGYIIRVAYLGDHIRLTDGTDLGPMLNNYTIDGNVILECQEGLPEAVKNRRELDLVFTVREILNYYYKDGGTLYRYTLNLSESSVTISIPNHGG